MQRDLKKFLKRAVYHVMHAVRRKLASVVFAKSEMAPFRGQEWPKSENILKL